MMRSKVRHHGLDGAGWETWSRVKLVVMTMEQPALQLRLHRLVKPVGGPSPVTLEGVRGEPVYQWLEVLQHPKAAQRVAPGRPEDGLVVDHASPSPPSASLSAARARARRNWTVERGQPMSSAIIRSLQPAQ